MLRSHTRDNEIVTLFNTFVLHIFLFKTLMIDALGSKLVAAIKKQHVLILLISCIVIVIFYLRHMHIDCINLQTVVMIIIFCVQQDM
jgi:hypothetical protein